MHFVSVAATFFAGLAAAVPAPQSTGAPDPATYENIDIAEFTVRENADGSLMATSFLLSGEAAANLTCSASDPSLPSEVYICGDSKYRFALVPGSEYKYGLRIYHELGTAVGFYGEGDVFTYCHAGGLDTMTCNQIYPTTIVIDSQ